MNGDDQALREILRALGGVESAISAQTLTNQELKEEVKELSERVESANLTCKNFEAFKEEYLKHKEERKNLPQRVQILEITAHDYEELKKEFIALKSQYNRLYILGIALQAIGLGLLWLIGQGYVRIEL